MRRLNDDELDARINKFLYRKFREFPELADAGTSTDKWWLEIAAKPPAPRLEAI